MKKITLITILIILVGGLKAQDKAIKSSNHHWRTEIASIFTGDNDLSGTSIYSEYYKYVGKRLKLAIGIGSQNFPLAQKGKIEYRPNLINGDLKYKGHVIHSNAVAKMIGLSCYYDIFKIKKINFELGFGCFLIGWNETNISLFIPFDDSIIQHYRYNSKKKISFTPSISLGSQLNLSDKIAVNLKGFYQQGVETNSKPVLGIAGGITLKWNNK